MKHILNTNCTPSNSLYLLISIKLADRENFLERYHYLWWLKWIFQRKMYI